MTQFILPILKWIFAFLFSPHSRKRVEKENIMLVSEKGNDARDNGWHFFKYVKANHPEIKAYYIITNSSDDRRRLDAYGDSVVEYLSYRHCRLFWQARYLVGTHLRAGHTPLPYALSYRLNRVLHIYKGKVVANLKHGITKDYLPRMHYSKTRYDLLVCGAYPEAQYFRSALGYPQTVAQYTGFCRFDRLHDFQTKRQILVMPTYRMYLNKANLDDSLFAQTYRALLANPAMAEMLERNDATLVFYPHHKFQPYVEEFRHRCSPRVIVADQAHYDVQQLLKESALLVTDYSSVFFDFAYMGKPMIFFQFDYDEYRRRHFQSGYFDYGESFGPVAGDMEALLRATEHYLQNDFSMESVYKDRIAEYFPKRDKENCKRVFEAIAKCAKTTEKTKREIR